MDDEANMTVDRKPAPRVVVRVPLWLALTNVLLLVLVLVLTGVLINIKVQDAREGTPDTAIQQLEREAKESESVETLLQLGFEYRKEGMLEDALRANRRIIEIDPKNVAARYHLGTILIELGRDKEAEQALWDGLEIDPTHAMTAKVLGELYASRGQFKSLLVAVEPAAEASPRLADLQYLLGLGREKTGDRDGAAQAYWDAVESDPGLQDARDGLDRVTEDAR